MGWQHVGPQGHGLKTGGEASMTPERMLDISLRVGTSIAFSNALWYAIAASGAWLFFYVLFRRFFRQRRISAAKLLRSQVIRELLHSLRSLAIFGAVGGVVVYCACWDGLRLWADRRVWVDLVCRQHRG